MKETKKTAAVEPEHHDGEHPEEEYAGPLVYEIGKCVFILRDNAQLHITNFMSGKPKDGPP